MLLARDRWHEEPAPACRTAGARRATWFEQPELWSDEPAASAEPLAASVAETPLVELPLSKRETLREEAQRAEIQDGEESLLLPAERKSRGGVRHMLEVMKLLQVNDGVNGACRQPLRFALPSRRFAPRLSLWRGAPVGTHFLTGC